MSQTEKFLSNIKEYYELLGFLDAKHPGVSSEWKLKNTGLPAQPDRTDDDDDAAKKRKVITLNDYEIRITR